MHSPEGRIEELEREVARLRLDRDDWKKKHWSAHDHCHQMFLLTEQMRDALCAVKLTCLTTKDGAKGLGHIVRICIDAGIVEKLDDLERRPSGAQLARDIAANKDGVHGISPSLVE